MARPRGGGRHGWRRRREDSEAGRRGRIPVRLKPADWNSGETVWLLDVAAPNAKLASAVVASFRQIAKSAPMRLRPIVSRLVDPELLKKLRKAA